MKVTLERTLKRAIKVQWGVRRKTPSLSAWWNDEGKGGVQRGREESLGSQKIRVFYPNVGKDYKERKEDKTFLRSTREKRRSVSTLRWWNSVALDPYTLYHIRTNFVKSFFWTTFPVTIFTLRITAHAERGLSLTWHCLRVFILIYQSFR